ncbi:hypothetical protein EYZ11_013231 [Aspergillus tanneri]|uniref:Alpha-1,2-mannosyltransferase (Mnn2) n=1 Tax=Aspergillus tanneri TaxID=1220188 RepID=A0A4S3J3L8_9EURO|nr:uncharacterized protein ATNIH1004_011727 [Aspergillus tanneri]KAA8641591.1 hypothetical protein ATNIH1004_011727 [Aspergillus tanneri]THC87321.1 hypothetical protein EYZ11_013231 [Aspergillus tanneri]
MSKIQYRSRRKIPVTLVATVFLVSSYILCVCLIGVLRTSPDPLPNCQVRLWHQLHALFTEHEPHCPSPTLRDSVGLPRFNAIKKSHRLNYINNADEIREPLRVAHDGFTQDMRTLDSERAYYAGSKGIVSAAGGPYLPAFVVTLRMLRRTGSTLPVELFMRDYLEYEPYICEVVLPPLQAQCIILSEIVLGGFGDPRYTIEHYQIKSFAILFSSFESVLWMDADCIPLYNPSPLLSSEPFISTGLVTWPDFWTNTASPLYFQISRQPEPPTTARQATEAGMLLISKKSHWMTLLLAAYYNYYGPSFYYRLLGQGAPGEGDKDTFLQAATAVGEEYYAVSEAVADLGHPDSSGKGVLGAAMLQADPMEDYALTSRGKWRVKDPSVAEAARGFFIHSYNPKFNPGGDLLGEKAQDAKGQPSRLWTASINALQRIGYDAEKVVWEEAKTVACTLEHAFETWKGKSGICEGVQKHWESLFTEVHFGS